LWLRSLGWNTAVLLILVATLAISGLRLRRVAGNIRKRVQNLAALLPNLHAERRWFVAVSLGAGIYEEIVFRGFLLYYLGLCFPHANVTGRVLLKSLFFGLSHLYQGWKGAVGAGILGLLFAGMYLMIGSLVMPMAVHAAIDLRTLLIFPPENLPTIAVEGNTQIPNYSRSLQIGGL
jgi:membrane protease YdiL (CAAX protease family)